MKLCLAAIVALLALAVYAQSGTEAHHHGSLGKDSTSPVIAVSNLMIPDVVLVNQRGETVHFYSDLVKGRVVAINTIFTTCTTICPIMGANFARLQKVLGDAGKQDVSLISISVDPLVDTPARLDQWMHGFGEVGGRWTALTGPKPDVERLLKALQVFTSDKNDHSPVVLIGGDSAGDWVRASGLLPASRLAEFINARRVAVAAHPTDSPRR